ncbi:MAG: minor capsid protein [Eubacteriales bacterium]|nr:minor capsid protein [Eubacteriales bacterium]MDY4214298.1 minor capsid protein [Eubacteriales bacterium]
MANSNYWRRRAERLEKQIHSGDRVPISRIMRLYKHAFDEIEDDIRRTSAARDELNRTEVEALKAEMIKIGASAPDPIRQAQITRAVSAYDYRIDRMEWLKSRAYMHLMKVAGVAAALVKPHLENAYRAARYGTIDDIAKGLNVGIDFSLIPKRTIERVVKSPFHGKNYSQRVWDNTAETAAKAQKIIVEGLIKGSSYPHIAQELARVTNNTYYNAYRLVQTETTHFTEMGRFDAYKDIGIEKYTYYATLGSKTCDVCAALDGKTFNIDEGIEGKNKPPIHPHCMCYTVIGDVKLTSRLARDPETGKNYKVRGDMTYNEWYEGLSQEKKTAIKAYKNRHTDEVQYTKYVKRLGGENMPKTLDLFQKMKYNDSEKWRYVKLDYQRQNALVNNPELALPNALSATADNRKFTEYLFGGTHENGLAKGAAFTSRLGYDIDNYDKLKDEILKKASKYPSVYKRKNAQGDLYEQKIILYGLKNKPANVVVGWIANNDTVRMTTSYIKELK